MRVKNEILEEVWKNKDEMGKKYSLDVEKIDQTGYYCPTFSIVTARFMLQLRQ
jgi:hypothetical protein